MKQSILITKIAKAIANNEVKSSAVRRLLMEIASTGKCRPCWQVSRAYSDHTDQVIVVLQQLGVAECKPSKKGNFFNIGYYIENDSPRGGKLGNIIRINFARF